MRILLATITAGAGHLQAAAALHETWLQARPQDVVQRLDLLTFFSPLHKKIYSDGYVKLIAHAPELWGLVFNTMDNPSLVAKLAHWKNAIGSNSSRKFARFVKQFAPDAVLCTHYLPVELLGGLRKKWPGPPPLTVSIVTDFEAHALWMDPNVDLYCVAAEETKARLVARGAPAAQVLVTGIPISAKFSGPIDAALVRKELGLRDDLPILLVLSGGFGMGPVAQILAALDQLQRPFQTLVVAGRNDRLRRDLASSDRRHPTRVLGFVANMHELMAVSDLLITKPGGLTTSEALALGKPLFILNPIPGQEAANSDFLLEHGAAAKANRVEDLPFRLGRLLGSKKLAGMARAAAALGRPAAAADICRAVAARVAARPSA
ncbi:MAG: glycosyltransferase [Verrucomicrobiota bacterium]|jgi:processive 1,2-diacylglycerol beta-glucosyltransferase